MGNSIRSVDDYRGVKTTSWPTKAIKDFELFGKPTFRGLKNPYIHKSSLGPTRVTMRDPDVVWILLMCKQLSV